MKESLLKHIENLGISDKLKNLVQPCVLFDLSNDSKSLSGVGGTPLIPDSIFPFYSNEKLRFLANINLREFYYSNSLLPNEGNLLFFIYTGNIGYRYPINKNEFKVIFDRNEIMEFSNESSNHFRIDYYEFASFPCYQDNVVEISEIDSEELSNITRLSQKSKKQYDVNHQIFGHPAALQGTVRFWWSLQYHGYKTEDVDNLSSEIIKKIKIEEDNFILLLQLSFGDSRIGIDYFGESVAYFGIHKSDLKKLNFDNAILVMQNT